MTERTSVSYLSSVGAVTMEMGDNVDVDRIIEELRKLDQIETRANKLVRKLRETPFLGVGLLGLVGAGIVGGYRFKSRPSSMSASQYLMQLRVAAQGLMVGSLALGVAFTSFRHQPSRGVKGADSED